MKKFLFIAALLSSTSLIASDNSFPDFNEVKENFRTSTLTTEINSEAGKFYREAVRKEGQKDDEGDLLKAVQLGHAHASRVLFSQYGDENPAYRELLVMSVVKKLEAGFKAGFDEEINILGHRVLRENGYSLVALLNKADSLEGVKALNKSSDYSYIARLTWKELGARVVDLDQANEVVERANQSLKQLAAQGNSDAIKFLEDLAAREGDFEEAKKHLFPEEK